MHITCKQEKYTRYSYIAIAGIFSCMFVMCKLMLIANYKVACDYIYTYHLFDGDIEGGGEVS